MEKRLWVIIQDGDSFTLIFEKRSGNNQYKTLHFNNLKSLVSYMGVKVRGGVAERELGNKNLSLKGNREAIEHFLKSGKGYTVKELFSLVKPHVQTLRFQNVSSILSRLEQQSKARAERSMKPHIWYRR